MDNVRIFPDSDALAQALALCLKDEAVRADSENRVYTVVLSGGETASNIYRQFAAPGFGDQIPWKSVHFFWSDERCVPPESEESNFGIAHRAFLKFISIPDENIHRIRGEENPDTESSRYGREVQEHLALRNSSENFFDWVFLGLGADGHTASIFPGQEEIVKTSNLCEVARHPQTDQKRVTLTPAAIKRSGRVTYHVVGSQKTEIVSALVLKPTQSKNYPAAHVAGEWFLDKTAASSLDSS